MFICQPFVNVASCVRRRLRDQSTLNLLNLGTGLKTTAFFEMTVQLTGLKLFLFKNVKILMYPKECVSLFVFLLFLLRTTGAEM